MISSNQTIQRTFNTCIGFIYAVFVFVLLCTMFRSVGSIRARPVIDSYQDVTATRAEHFDGRTTIYFTRPRTGRDPSPEDIALDDPVFMLWAFGPLNAFNPLEPDYHGGNRGSSMERIEFPSADECPSIGKNHTVIFMGTVCESFSIMRELDLGHHQPFVSISIMTTLTEPSPPTPVSETISPAPTSSPTGFPGEFTRNLTYQKRRNFHGRKISWVKFLRG